MVQYVFFVVVKVRCPHVLILTSLSVEHTESTQ